MQIYNYMVERESDIFKQTDERLRVLNDNLKARNMECDVDLMGVIHDGLPESDIITKLQKSDLVTLELTRRAVDAALVGEDSKILRKNTFWKAVIENLKAAGKTSESVRGIEVNQTPRIAWKRLMLHYGLQTLAASPLTIEVDKDHFNDLGQLLEEPEILKLQQFNWLITDDLWAYDQAVELVRLALDARTDDRFLPLDLAPGISLVCSNYPESEKDLDKKRSLTLMAPPHPSLVQALETVSQSLINLGYLNEQEANSLGFNALSHYLLSPSELTEVKEIAYFANQQTKQRARGSSIEILHLGGAYHTPVLTDIFTRRLPNDPKIYVQPSYDQRLVNLADLEIADFFRNFIPFSARISAVRIVGFETEVQPELVGQQTVEAIMKHEEEFLARLKRYRDHNSKKNSYNQ